MITESAVRCYQAVPFSSQDEVCFQPETIASVDEQNIVCILAQPGDYPSGVVSAHPLTHMCCFSGIPEYGVFWAIGETLMSRVKRFDFGENQGMAMHAHRRMRRLYLYPMENVHLLDIHVLDATTDDPVRHAHVTMADDTVHMVSYQKVTDSDGYAVIPVIEGQNYTITVRANGYLPAKPFKVSTRDVVEAPLMYHAETETDDDEAQDAVAFNPDERVVELDPGIQLKGVVLDAHSKPVEKARLHADVVLSDGLVWSSDLDQPRPVSALASMNRQTWFPKRSEMATSVTGKFLIETIPHGVIKLYATHEQYPPSGILKLDARDRVDLDALEIRFPEPKCAWVRVQNASGTAISTTLSIIDENSGYEMDSVTTPTSGALELKRLPGLVRFRVQVENMPPYEVVKRIAGDDEIILVPDFNTSGISHVYVQDTTGGFIDNVTVHLADASIQKKYPVCMAKTDRTGHVSLESCPEKFWLSVYHPDYGREILYISKSMPELYIQLQAGVNASISLMDMDQPVSAQCTVEAVYISDENQYILSESYNSVQGKLVLNHLLPKLNYKLKCTAGLVQKELSFDVEHIPEKIEFPHQVDRSVIVLDSFGAALPYARIVLNHRDFVTDEKGRMTLHAPVDEKLTVYHWQHGQTEVVFKQDSRELEVKLPDTVSESLLKCLQRHQMAYMVDSATVYLNESVPRYRLNRGDMVESCDSSGMVVVRNDRRMNVSF